ncbi:unnamed protein product [Brachionus calyciflorus]|uniref:Uncharacterized protein n=1 Tax=Brachionus calyciflorus TaxID=104777 RepID=A0A813VNH7_9BILA|nr:unnamed protein product [Brachionus calyciflorus]
MLIINRKKEKVGVAQQNISSYDKDENVKEESSDLDTDEEPDSDNKNKENVEYNATKGDVCHMFYLLQMELTDYILTND